MRKPYSAVDDVNQITNSITEKHKNKPYNITLIDRAVKPLYVQPNRDRKDILNNNVTRYWEMSLRNNNKELLEYMKGTKYDGAELEQLFQTTGGMKEVEKSIPTLDFRSS